MIPVKPASRDEFREMLRSAGVGSTSPRTHSAMKNLKDDYSNATELLEQAVQLERDARETWIRTALDPWCERHGLTRAQALSVLFRDDAFNPKDPQKDLVTQERIFAWGGQQNDFAGYLINELEAAKIDSAAKGALDRESISQHVRPRP